MISKETSIVINRPVEQVFATMADAKNQPKWDSALSEVRLMPDGPVGVGTKISEVRTFLGRTSVNTTEVIEFEPNARITRKTAGEGPFKVGGFLTFNPAPNGTTVNWKWDLQFSGFLALVGPFIASAMIKGADKSLIGLKNLLEGRAEIQ